MTTVFFFQLECQYPLEAETKEGLVLALAVMSLLCYALLSNPSALVLLIV